MSSSALPEVRNLQFAVGDHIPRHWHGGRKSVTAFFNNLSIFFPAGERFFIASVKAYRDALSDPELAAHARAFYAQEGIHSREHIRYNAMLQKQGYPVDAMEKRVVELLARVTRRTPKRMQLGVTCALEHFTALMADMLLSHPRWLEGADPTMAKLWRWHAAEENEHKAVAFDVFKAVGGTYGERVWTMLGATVIFWAKVLEHQVRLMRVDGTVRSPREWLALARFLFVGERSMLSLLPKYLDYFRPSFHPWDHDNRALLEAWKQELPAYDHVA